MSERGLIQEIDPTVGAPWIVLAILSITSVCGYFCWKWLVFVNNNLVIFSGKVVLSTSLGSGKIVGQLKADDDDLETVAFPEDPQLGYFALGKLQ